ncbi:hypothetical protein Mal64_12540 [Pseudobythopirellula maris]|uniref:LamG-like jellyroll fold domain-containing protein n=1 Tax=Pseudobythopirellula maris TaxID=2527991 RepID=A0A5C5ZUG8_9BACT|nr:LamG domain-containing protein [Pseudobythopirellula maris]TWT90856.1 hypothetical protein Mal64_12540 [Pseudobythopirellula maris]
MIARPPSWLVLSILLLATPCGAVAQELLFVRTSSGSYSAQEQSRVTQFENWGYTVTPIHDEASQASFDTAFASANVVYISSTANENQVSGKCKSATVGVVCEQRYIDKLMGFSTNQGWNSNFTSTTILDNTHPVTAGLATGAVTIVSSSQPLTMMNSTVAGGMTILSRNPSYGNGNMLGVMEAGASLGGGGVAAGRRVRLPWGSGSFDWSALNANGLLIARQALEWAVSERLLAHWTFDEGSGVTIADSSGNGEDAAFATGTPAWVSGVRGNALQFNGSNDAETDSTFDPPPIGSVAFWFRCNADPASVQRLFGLGDDWEVILLSGGALYCNLSNNSTGDFRTADGVATAGKWRHVVAIYNSTGDTYKLYLDGELVSSGSVSMSDQGAATLSFGVRTGTTNRFDGALDDIRVYNYELSEPEIAEVYGLVGHWKLDESAGTTAADSSLSSADGTYTGGMDLAAEGPYPGEGEIAAEFDGSNDYIALPNQEIDFSDGLTIALWAHPEGSGNWRRFVGLGNGPYVDNILFTQRAGTTDLFFELHDGSLGSRSLTASDAVRKDEWAHYVATIDGSGDAILYRDAEAIASGVTGVPASVLRTNNNIGESNWSSDDFYEGRMADVRLYNRPLSQAEVSDLYGLIGRWKLEESSGSTAVDSSGIGNDGTYVNAPTLGVGGTGAASTGTAVLFDGVDQHVTIPYHEIYAANEFSVTAWFRREGSLSSDQGGVIGARYGNDRGFDLKVESDRLHSDVAGVGDSFASTAADIEEGDTGTNGVGGRTASYRWYHVAYVVNAADLEADLYLNGDLKETVPLSELPLLMKSEQTLRIGHTGYGEEYFLGRLSDVRLYSRRLGPEEIEAQYSGGKTPGVRITRWIEVR